VRARQRGLLAAGVGRRSGAPKKNYIPDEVVFRTKPQIALELVDRALAHGVRVQAWTFDEGYGGKPEFLGELSARQQRYVAEVPRNFSAWLKAPRVVTRPYHRGRRGRGRTVPRLASGSRRARRVDALLAIQRLHQQYGHIQEVIIQNFRAKPAIPMANAPEPDTDELLRTIAVARLLLRDMNIQAPPNLTEKHYERLLQGGIDDWGGVSPLTPDYINPEAPWPHLAELKRRTEAAGQQLRQRLPVYPEFVSGVVDRGGLLAGRLLAASDDHGYARAA